MSLLALAAASAAAASLSASAPAPSHNVTIDHRGKAYSAEYRASIATSTRTIGIAQGPRPGTQRCTVTVKVSVERIIADGAHALTATLPGEDTYTRHLPGHCRSKDSQIASLVEDKAPAIDAHLAQVAAADRSQALAAIDAAHHFAAN